MLDLTKIRAIGLDLDDTLWPVWPVIEGAERAMQSWLRSRAPIAAGTFADPAARLALRKDVERAHPELGHDLSALRRACIHEALHRAGEDTALAEAAFEVFFEHRMKVTLFDDVLPALQQLASRFPIIAISNGNADVERVGLGAHIRSSMSAQRSGFAKPDVRIFHAAARELGVPPDAVLHVGDDQALDVLGGLDAGMQTVWVNRGNHAWAHAREPHVTVTDLRALCVLLDGGAGA